MMHHVFTEGFLRTNADLKAQPFGVEFSGTTVVSVMVSGRKAVCANCGDSRAVLGSLKPPGYRVAKGETKTITVEENDHFWVAKPLS